jgi:tetratricopeptide (TPR) repeat protein
MNEGAPPLTVAPPGSVDPRDATVLIRVASSLRRGRGSGFVVGDGGWVVTAYHVVAASFGKGRTVPEGALLVLSPWTGHWYEAQLRSYDEAADIALLRLDVTGLPALAVDGLEEKDPAALGARWKPLDLCLTGFPAHLGVEAQPEQAAADIRGTKIVESGQREGAAICFLQPVPGLQGGWSGGAVTRSDTGAVIGVFHSVFRSSRDPETPYPAASAIPQLGPLLRAAGADPAQFLRPPAPSLAAATDARERVARQIRCITHAARGRWREVEAEEAEDLRQAPDGAEAHFLLGIARAAEKDLEGAMAEFRTADAQRPHSVLIPLYLGLALQEKGEAPAAEKEFRRAIGRFPKEPEARLGLARALVDQARTGEARQVLRELRDALPNHPVVRHQLGLIALQEGEPDEALKELREALSLTAGMEGYLSIRVAYARALEAKKQYREAEREYRTVTRRDPDNVEGHFYLANLYLKQGRYPEARIELARLKGLPVTEPGFVLGLKEIEGKLGGK